MENERMTPNEAQAVIALWSQRQWERRHWPTAADIAEGLEISVAEAEALLREVRTHPQQKPTPNPLPVREGTRGRDKSRPYTSFPSRIGRVASLSEPGGFLRLTTTVAGLTGFFCLFLSRLFA